MSGDCGEGSLAPVADFLVEGHPVPGFGAVPAHLVLVVVLVDLDRSYRLCEVDQVYMLVIRSDVLELHSRGTVELYGIFDVLTLLAGELYPQAGFLEDLADGGVIG